MRCTHIKANGKRCAAICLKGETKCLFHSKSEQGKEGRRKQQERTPMTLEQHVLVLEKELRRVRKSKNEEFRSGETRRIIDLIYQIKGEKAPSGDGKKSSTFEKKLEKWQKKKNQT